MPRFVAFITSLMVIGACWAAHHRAFGPVARFDRAILFPNLLLLAVAFMPFASGFMGVNMSQRMPMLFIFPLALVASPRAAQAASVAGAHAARWGGGSDPGGA